MALTADTSLPVLLDSILRLRDAHRAVVAAQIGHQTILTCARDSGFSLPALREVEQSALRVRDLERVFDDLLDTCAGSPLFEGLA